MSGSSPTTYSSSAPSSSERIQTTGRKRPSKASIPPHSELQIPVNSIISKYLST